MSEPDLILYYGLSAGAGLVLARVISVVSEYLRQHSKMASFSWLDSVLSEHQLLPIREIDLIHTASYGQQD
jgi:hypothetical protein